MGRAPCCDKVGMKKGRWTAEEDDILTKYVQANGEGSWRSLPKNAGLLRCGKSCRLRWINYLKADLKRGNISAEEESLIVKLHASFGNRWSLIASHLPGRTDNEIKNYWNSHLSRKIYSFRETTNTNNTTKEIPLLQGIIEDPPPKRKGGRTSRWAMKKNKNYVQKILIKTPKQSNAPQNNQRPAVTLPPQNNGAEDRSDGLHQLPSLDGEKNTHDDMLGPCPEVVINGGEALGFNDIMDTCALEASGVLRREEEEERESNNNNDVVVINEEGNERGDTGCNSLGTVDPESSSSGANHSSNGELHFNSSSMASGLEENWDWESVMQLNHYKGQSVSSWEQNENLLTWLWDDDEWEKDFQIFEDIDPQKHNAMLSWFSS